MIAIEKSFLFINIGIFYRKLIELATSNHRVCQDIETIITALLTFHFYENAEKNHTCVFLFWSSFSAFNLFVFELN